MWHRVIQRHRRGAYRLVAMVMGGRTRLVRRKATGTRAVPSRGGTAPVVVTRSPRRRGDTFHNNIHNNNNNNNDNDDKTVWCRASSAEAMASLEGGEGFVECVARVSSLAGGALSEEESASAVREAFGWGKQTYWRQSKVEERPAPDAMDATVAVLLDLGMTEEEVCEIVRAFPEFLGCDADLVRKNVDYVTKTFFVRNKALLSTLSRKPQVLGNTVDCEGNCVGECNRCWVRF